MTNREITPDNLADTIEKTAQFLEDQGWCFGALSKFDWPTQTRSYCTLGALREVEDDHVIRIRVEKALACAIGQPAQTRYGYPTIATWNDRHRNGKSVISKLRKAAAKIRTGECS